MQGDILAMYNTWRNIISFKHKWVTVHRQQTITKAQSNAQNIIYINTNANDYNKYDQILDQGQIRLEFYFLVLKVYFVGPVQIKKLSIRRFCIKWWPECLREFIIKQWT